MFKIYFGWNEDALGSPKEFFNLLFNRDYLVEQYSKDVIKALDNSIVTGKNTIESPVLGGIDPIRLSNSVKNLLIAKYYPDIMICSAFMGQNCLPFLCEIAMSRDVLVSMDAFFIPQNYGYSGKIEILNTGAVVDDDDKFLDEYLEWDENRGRIVVKGED